jgi:hypothetical protein
MGWNLVFNKKRISNIEQGMSNDEVLPLPFGFCLRHSLFDIRYSFQAHSKFIILKLMTAEEPAKHLPTIIILPSAV